MAGRRTARVQQRVVALLILVALLVSGGLVLRWAVPPVRLPTPTGPHPVGTAVVEWADRARGEPATADRRDHRFVVAQLWYPAAAGSTGPPAWYLGRDEDEAKAVADGVADAYGLPAFVLHHAGRATAPARPGAPVAESPGRLPVVLFSPGLQGVRQQNTAWAIELASHGYVVAAVDHPYDSAVVVRTDGTLVRTAVRASGDDAEDQRRADG